MSERHAEGMAFRTKGATAIRVINLINQAHYSTHTQMIFALLLKLFELISLDECSNVNKFNHTLSYETLNKDFLKPFY